MTYKLSTTQWRDAANQSAMYYARRRKRLLRTQQELDAPDVYDGPIGSWSAIANGTALDTAAMTNLTVNGGVTEGVDPIPAALGDWTVDALGSTVYDGSTGYLASAATVTAFNFGIGDFAVNWWMNPAAPWGVGGATVGLIGQKLSDSNGGFQIFQDSGHPGLARFRMSGVGGTNQTDFLTTGTIATGAWTMATFVRQGGVCSWYLNGAFDSTFTPDPAVSIIADGSPLFKIGYADTWTAYYAGALWNIAIWNRALLLPDIAVLYQTPPVISG